MATWRLIVEDYGKIKSAEIEMAPLTLFVGDNNSGKSYLLSLLWGVENLGVESLIGNRYIKCDETDILVKWIYSQIEIGMEQNRNVVSLGSMERVLGEILNIGLKKNKDNLVRKIFNSVNVKIGKLFIELGDLTTKNLEIEYDKNTDRVKFSINEYGLYFPKDMIKQDFVQKYESINWMLVQCIYNGVMHIDWPSAHRESSIYLPAARTGFMLTKDIINKFSREKTFNLPDEKEDIIPFIRPINHFLNIIGDLSVENTGKEKNLKLVSDIESEMTNGSIEVSTMPNKEVIYVPTGYKKGIPIRLASAVVTELSPLILILKHKKDVNRFFYEEPEMCLHPQLQCKMGKIIGRIVNSGINMVITTHSDIILQHINNMIKLMKRNDSKEICERLGYTQSDLISSNQVKVYQLKAKTRGKTDVVELHCGENGFCVPTFNDALDSIMNEAYEIQG